jgi:hypothetical protein
VESSRFQRIQGRASRPSNQELGHHHYGARSEFSTHIECGHLPERRNQGLEYAQGPSLIRQQGQGVVILTRRDREQHRRIWRQPSPSFAQESEKIEHLKERKGHFIMSTGGIYATL